jgi:hypothetical protein
LQGIRRIALDETVEGADDKDEADEPEDDRPDEDEALRPWWLP